MDTSENSGKPEPPASPSDPPPTPAGGSQAPPNSIPVAQEHPVDVPSSTGPDAAAGLKIDSEIRNGAVMNPDDTAAAAAAYAVNPVSSDATAPTPNINSSAPGSTSTSDGSITAEDTEALAAALIKAANAAAVEVGAPGAMKGTGNSNATGAVEQSRRKRTRRGGWDTPAVMPAATTSAAFSAPMAPPVPAMTPMQEFQKKLAQEQVAAAMGQAPSVASVSAGAAALGLAMKPGGAGATATAPTIPTIPDNPKRIYIGSIHYDVKESDIAAIFAAFGPVKSVEMSKNPTTGGHKGFCFLEYAEQAGSEMALSAMNGFKLAGRAIKVGKPQNAAPGEIDGLPSALQLPGMAAFMAQRSVAALGGAQGGGSGNTAAEQLKAAMTMTAPPPQTKIYVGNVEPHITNGMIKTIFEPFGTVVGAEMVPDPSNPGNHKGFGFIQYTQESVARTVLDTMAGFELAGRTLKVAWAQDQSKPALSVGSQSAAAAAAAAAGAAVGAAAQAAALAAKVASSAAVGGAAAAAATVRMSTAEQLQAALGNAGGVGTGTLGPGPMMGAMAAEQLQAAIGNGGGRVGVSSAGGVGTGTLGPGAVMGASLGQQAVVGTAQAATNQQAVAAAQRAELMRKIAEGRIQGTVGAATAAGSSRCLCLKNVLQPEEAEDAESRQDILKEAETCGTVEKFLVHQQRASGGTVVAVRVFVLFSTLEAAAAAVKKMHGRFFAGNQIQAVLYDYSMFSMMLLDA